jgi:hypothetical protein
MANDPTMTDPSATPDEGADAPGGYTIEINVSADGKITVGVEPASEESAEESGSAQPGDDAEGTGDDTQPVANAREAAKLVVDIINNAGQMQDTGADDAAMSGGYGKPGAM